MPARPTLHDFIDDELLRAPMTIDTVIDTVIERWRLRMPRHNRQDSDPLRALTQHRDELVRTALANLRLAVQAELQAHPEAQQPAAAAPSTTRRMALALIDEDDVVVDIEIARCTETVKLKAEIELRALQTYTSALVNDPNVSRDTNPFRPEGFVRALWAGVQTLPVSRATMAVFLHEAAEPLAEALRRAYATGWQRLDEQGITPAAHRTIVAAGGGANWAAERSRSRAPQDLNALHGSLQGAFQARPPASAAPRAPLPQRPMPPVPGAALADAEPAAGAGAAPAPDRTLIELLTRLFEAIEADPGLGADIVPLLQRLQPAALRAALRDPSVLDSYDHPLWRFVDRLAHDIQTSGPGQRLRLLGLGRNLVDHLASAGLRQDQGFEWALERLLAAGRHALAQSIAAAGSDIGRLQRLAVADLPATTSTMPLDIGTLDTVPAALLTEPAAAQAGSTLLDTDGLRPGTPLRAYLQGEWRSLMALWQDHGHELALLREPATERLWALRQRALARLLTEGLAQPLRVRSLVRRAADRVLRGL